MNNISGFHQVDNNNKPVGGRTLSKGIDIDWTADNSLKNVLLACIDRLEFLQTTSEESLNNQIAIMELRCAIANTSLSAIANTSFIKEKV